MHTLATPSGIAYDKVGDGGPSLLCLPGWAAERSMFRAVISELGRDRTSIALDWRGHGDSSPADADFGTADLVGDALAGIEAEGLETVVPIAQAHAGWVAIELRRQLGPDRVPAFVSLSWMVLGPPPPFVAALSAMQDRDSWEEARDSLLAMWTTGVVDQAVLDFVSSMATYDFTMWARASRCIATDFERAGSPVAALDALAPPCPTLHLYATPTDTGFLDAQQAYATTHPWFQVQRLEATSHFPSIEVPRQVAAAVNAFLAAPSQARSAR